jgi:hypothetical protein
MSSDTTHEDELLRQRNVMTGVETGDSSRRVYDEDDGLTEDERELADALDAYAAKAPSRDEQEAVRKAATRNYTGLRGGADAIILAIRLDDLTNARS